MSTPEPKRDLDCFFNPRHVAVIGASRTPGKLGHTVLRNLLAGGFEGRVSAVNASGEDIAGASGYRRIGDVPQPVDCAFLAIPAAASVDALAQCAAAGVRGVIVGASGFAELGTAEGRARQQALLAIARGAGMRVIGPNTNGLMNTAARLTLGYNASHAERFAAGDVSIVSHSGALFDGIARRLRQAGAGLASFVPVGNEIDVTMLDVVESLIADAQTRVIGLVIEALDDGPRLRALAARAAAAGRSIVALKIGRSARGAGAALAHSSRLAGSARAYDALFEACCIATVGTVEALAGACALLSGRSAAAAPAGGLVCVTTSGAGGAILADFASERSLRLAGSEGGAWGEAATAQIAALPTSAAIRNPIDMGSLGDWALLAPVLQAVGDEGEDGATVVYAHVAPGPGMAAHLAAALIERRQRCSAPVAVLTPGGLGDEAEAAYTAAGIPVFHDTAACFDSLQACLQTLQWHAAERDSPSLAAPADDPRASDSAFGKPIGALIDAAAPAAGLQGFISERASAGILRACGLPMVASDVVTSAAEARRSAARCGGPVVLKALVPGVAHKNAQGLVLTRIEGPEAAALAFERLAARVAAAGCAPSQVEYLLQPMHPAELELILGVSHEPGLGHFLVFGLGGIHAEVFDRVELLALPVSPLRLRERLLASPVARLLRAVDPGLSAGWLAEVEGALLALQRLMQVAGERIDSVDVNPLRVGADGCLAVDALVVLRAKGDDAAGKHATKPQAGSTPGR
jgi:acyl-CoA synthetase (NDP forming)